MAAYIGEVAPALFKPFPLKENDPRFRECAVLYQQEFHDNSTAVDVAAFSCGSHHNDTCSVSYQYWLWGLDPADGGGFAGLASFFSFPHCGFGGYIALGAPLRGRGHFRLLLQLLERQIVESNPRISGWYVECGPASIESSVFRHCGFTTLPMTYGQPPLHSGPSCVSEYKQKDPLPTTSSSHLLWTASPWTCFQIPLPWNRQIPFVPSHPATDSVRYRTHSPFAIRSLPLATLPAPPPSQLARTPAFTAPEQQPGWWCGGGRGRGEERLGRWRWRGRAGCSHPAARRR